MGAWVNEGTGGGDQGVHLWRGSSGMPAEPDGTH